MNKLKVAEYRNVRVLTTQQIAEVYGADARVVSNNFNRNRNRYEEGKHFICLEGDEKREFLNHHQFDDGSKNAVKFYLWTERGAFLHAKSLNTDKAWEAYSDLVDGYYNQQDVFAGLSQEMKAIVMLDKKQVQIENRMDKLEFEIPLYGAEADELSGHVKRKGVKVLGGKQSEAYKDTEIRSKVYHDIYGQIKREFDLYDSSGRAMSYKALKRKYLADAHELIDCYDAPKYLVELINNSNAQMGLSIA